MTDAILSGSATTDDTVMITIPAGKWWRGSISISSSLAAGANVGAQQATPVVKVHGTNSDPADGSVLTGVSLATPAVGLLALLGVTSNQSLDQSNVIMHAPAANSITVKLHTPSSAVTIATAHGIVTDF
jgi:hypothetical protein